MANDYVELFCKWTSTAEGLPCLPKGCFQDRACPLSESLEGNVFFPQFVCVTVDEPLPNHQEWRSNFHGDSSSGTNIGPGSHAVLDRLFSSALVLPAGVFNVHALLCPGAVVL